mmetsp:Transcript_26558/g.76499  ORF Transcript_26558/g.76499 Transcript_26558/m.76499 type:complete len:163 (-) Transcript_26558:1931-2419(-)
MVADFTLTGFRGQRHSRIPGHWSQAGKGLRQFRDHVRHEQTKSIHDSWQQLHCCLQEGLCLVEIDCMKGVHRRVPQGAADKSRLLTVMQAHAAASEDTLNEQTHRLLLGYIRHPRYPGLIPTRQKVTKRWRLHHMLLQETEPCQAHSLPQWCGAAGGTASKY